MKHRLVSIWCLACALLAAAGAAQDRDVTRRDLNARARADPSTESRADSDSIAAHFRTLMEAWRYAKAESVAVKALAAAEAEHGASSSAVARALEWRAEARARGGHGDADRDSAITWARQAVAICEAGDDTLALVGSLVWLGRLQNRDLGSGRAHLERAVALCEQTRGPDALECSEAILQLGRCRAWKTILGVARPTVSAADRRRLVERALQIREHALGPNHPDVAECLIALAEVQEDSTDGLVPLLQRARKILEMSRGADHLAVAGVLQREGHVHFLRREFGESESCFTRALGMFEARLGPMSGAVGALINNHGADLLGMGDYDKALPLFRRWIDIAAGLGWFSRWLSYEDMGLLLMYMGDYAEAERWLQRSVDLFSQHVDTHPGEFPTRLGNLEQCLWLMGDYERSLSVARRIVAFGDSLGLDVIGDRATLAMAKGDTTYLSMAIDTMLAPYADLPLGTWSSQDLNSQRGIAGWLILCGRYDRALSEYQRLAEEFDSNTVRGSVWHGQLLSDLAATHRILGNEEEADRVGVRAQAMLEQRLGAKHPLVARTQLVLAGIRRQRGDTVSAFSLAREAEATRREYVRVITRALPEAQALRFAATQPSGLGLLLTTAATSRDPEQARTAWDALVRTRGLVQEEMAGRWREVLGGNLCTSAYGEASRRYARLLVGSLTAQPGDYYVQELERAREASERAERELAQSCAAFGEERARTHVGLADVTGALPPAGALVAYARVPADEVLAGGEAFEPFVRGRSAEASAVYVALVQSAAGGDPRAVLLGHASSIDSLVARWRDAAGTRPGAKVTAEKR